MIKLICMHATQYLYSVDFSLYIAQYQILHKYECLKLPYILPGAHELLKAVKEHETYAT